MDFSKKNKIYIFSCLVNCQQNLTGSTFLRFFRGWKYQRRKIKLLKFYIKMKKLTETSEKINFLKKNKIFFFRNRKRTCKCLNSRLFEYFFESTNISKENWKNCYFTSIFQNPAESLQKRALKWI